MLSDVPKSEIMERNSADVANPYISDAEFLDFLAGYNDSNNPYDNPCMLRQSWPTTPRGHSAQSHPVTVSHENLNISARQPLDHHHQNTLLHQPWREDEQFSDGQNHNHVVQELSSRPPPPSLPPPPSVPPSDNNPSPKKVWPQRDDKCFTSFEGVERGIVERWEPGEILEDSRVTSSSPSSSIGCQTPPPLSSNSKKAKKEKDVSLVHDNTPSSTPKKRGPRPKVLTPMEKRQKRADANDRERERMGRLNTAFDSLRHLLPRHGNDRELSKFETIQIAKNYIRALNEMLEETDKYFNRSTYDYEFPQA